MILRTALGVACLLAVSPAVASDELYTSCIDATVTNPEWLDCGNALIRREEARMAAVWKQLEAVATKETMDDLAAEQSAWLAYRESACRIYDDPEQFGREGQVLSFPACIAGLIAQRSEQLQSYRREIDP